MSCDRCELHKIVKSVLLPSRGKPESGLFFVLERPLPTEDWNGMSFTSQSARLFVSLLERANLNVEEDYYLTYAAKCACPEAQKDLKTPSFKTCTSNWLKSEILTYKPKVVVAVGMEVMKHFLPGKSGILKHRGSFFDVEIEGHKFKVIPTLSPAYILKENRELEVQVLSDIKRAHDAIKSGVNCWNPAKLKDLNYKIIETVEDFNTLYDEIVDRKIFSCDIETRGLNPYKDERNDGMFPLVSIQFSTAEKSGWFLPIAHEKFTSSLNADGFAWTTDDWQVIFPKLKDILENNDYFLIGHNFKFDSKWIYKTLNIKPHLKFDTMLAHGLFEETSNSLKKLAWKYTDLGGYEEAQSDLNKKLDYDMFKYPYEGLATYGCCDVDVTLRIFNKFNPQVSNNKEVFTLFTMLMDASRAFLDIEHDGIKIDRVELDKLEVELDLEIQKAIADFRLQAPREIDEVEREVDDTFNLSSATHVSKLFYDKLKFPINDKLRSKKTENPSVGREALKELSDKEIAKILLVHRKASKQKVAFVDAYRKWIDNTDRIHPDYKLIKFFNEEEDSEQGTSTGRLACSSPNLQQVPARDETKRIKKLFLPDSPSHVFLDCDYSGIELRVTAMHAEEPKMRDFFAKGSGDFHTWSASMLLNKKAEDITPIERAYAKNCVFGVLYGAGPAKIASQIGCSIKEAEHFMEEYFKFFPNLKKWINSQKAFAQQNLYVKSKFGRIRFLPDARSKVEKLKEAALRKAVNSVIQSDASDITLYGLTKIHKFLTTMTHTDPEHPTRLRGSIHDSILLSVNKKDFDVVFNTVKFKILENPDIDFVRTSGVRLLCGAAIGPSWGNQVKIEE